MHPDLRYDDLVAELRTAGCVFAEDEAALLLQAAGDLRAMVARRIAGEPLEWIVGWADFGGLRIAVSPGVFVPRRRTVFLADSASRELSRSGARIVVELCCGTGAVTRWLQEVAPDASYYATDVDPVAVTCARSNIPAATVLEGDLFGPLPDRVRGRVDVIVANTPYVPSAEVRLLPPEAREHEPLHTLDGGADGLTLLRRISAEASQWLRPGGHLVIEISEGQWDTARAVYETAGLSARCRVNDGTHVAIGEYRAGVRSHP